MLKRIMRIAAGLALALALTGCAAPAAQQSPGTDASALQAELDAISQEMAALQQELDALRGIESQAEASAAGEAAPVQEENNAAQQEAAPIQAEIPLSRTQTTPIPVSNTDEPPAGYTRSVADYDLEGLAAETAAAVNQAEAAERRSTWDENYALYREIDRVLEDMDRKLDQAENQAERDYRDGLLARADYVEVERQIESLEDDLDRADDVLEYRLGVDD